MDFVQRSLNTRSSRESDIANFILEVAGKFLVLEIFLLDQIIVRIIKMLKHGFKGSVLSSIGKSIMMCDKNQTEI